MLTKRHPVLKNKHHVAQQFSGAAAGLARAALETQSGVFVKQGLEALGELHLRRHPQNTPRHIWAKFFAAHSAVCCLLNGWAVLCWDVAAHPPHARRTGADTNGRGKRRGTADGLHGLLKWCHGSFFVNTNVIVKQTPT
jgi:hypothetical protein